MTKNPKRPRDPNQLGKSIIDIATGERSDDVQVSSERSASGAKGGARRAAAMTPEQRAEAAKLAAQARWRKRD